MQALGFGRTTATSRSPQDFSRWHEYVPKEGSSGPSKYLMVVPLPDINSHQFYYSECLLLTRSHPVAVASTFRDNACHRAA